MGLKGIDTAVGLYNCSDSQKIYDLVLESVYEEGTEKLPQAEEFFQRKDYKNYAILVHGLKSVAMSIGAVEFSNMAKSLELAAKDGELAFITDHQEEFIRCYRELLEELHNYLLEKV